LFLDIYRPLFRITLFWELLTGIGVRSPRRREKDADRIGELAEAESGAGAGRRMGDWDG